LKKLSYVKKVFVMIFIMILSISFFGCSSNSSSSSSVNKGTVYSSKPKNSKDPIVTIEMEDGAKITIELYPDVAPNTVKNFISLTEKGFYNGLIFHRVIPNFMIQGGDPQGTGMGGPGYSIKGEFKANGVVNDLKHERGVISMARFDSFDSAGSQFFIMVAAAPTLDGQYAAFGKVLNGMDEVDKIVNVSRDGNDKPLKDEKMKKVSVETFGIKYGDVEKK
jgi:peptidyl-prolyl cis-trans isomerase B (cyclophilin B)